MTKKELLLEIVNQLSRLHSRIDQLEYYIHEQEKPIRLCEEHQREGVLV